MQPQEKRSEIIKTVQTPLGFFVLVVLIAELSFGVLSSIFSGPERMYLIWSMIILIFCLVMIVAVTMIRQPEALYGIRPTDTKMHNPPYIESEPTPHPKSSIRCYDSAQTQQKKISSDVTGKDRELTTCPLGRKRLSIIVGDRRESPPETPGDFFANSPSPRDLTWLMSLVLPWCTVLWNDKIISATTKLDNVPKYLSSRDLLIIGSPYCNLMARHINNSAFFRFNIDRDILNKINTAENSIIGIGRHDPLLKKHWDELHSSNNYHQWLMKLRGNGFVDPLQDQYDVGGQAGHNDDYATVSFCKHPYSREHNAIFVAGLHLPGTMVAVAKLSDVNFFEKHPLGGIIKVEIPEGEWFERLTRASCSWSTPEYTVSDFVQKLSLIDKKKNIRIYNAQEIADCLELINEIEGYTVYKLLGEAIGGAKECPQNCSQKS